jgi:hypothetical protein
VLSDANQRTLGPCRGPLRRSAETLQAPDDVLADLDTLPEASSSTRSLASGPRSVGDQCCIDVDQRYRLKIVPFGSA